MKVSLLQLDTQPDRDHNLREVHRLMKQAMAEEGPDLIVLPEHFEWAGGTVAQKLAAADVFPQSEGYRLLQDFAREHAVHIHGGSLLERSQGSEKVHNTSVIFAPDGSELGRYQKIHLFDVTTPDGLVYRESDTVVPGDHLLVYEACGFRIGCAICYDLRFARLFDALAVLNVDAIILPAAFTLQTGKDHWEVLCRARAIETQAYFIGCGQYGSYQAAGGETRHAYGNSLICDPWGQVIVRASNRVSVVSARIEREPIERARSLIPCKTHRVTIDHLPVRHAHSCSHQCGTCSRADRHRADCHVTSEVT